MILKDLVGSWKNLKGKYKRIPLKSALNSDYFRESWEKPLIDPEISERNIQERSLKHDSESHYPFHPIISSENSQLIPKPS